jgi:hypothetical protein
MIGQALESVKGQQAYQLFSHPEAIAKIDAFDQAITPLLKVLATHKVFCSINSIAHARVYLQHQVFAVWDFMCLLKSLYRKLSTKDIWYPPTSSISVHLIGSIMLEEESDINEQGDRESHFETFVRAMEELDTDTSQIRGFIAWIKEEQSIEIAFEQIDVNPSIKKFVLSNAEVLNLESHEVLSAFVFGRELITSIMFTNLMKALQHHMNYMDQSHLCTLISYLNRHISLDADEHFPKALKALIELIGDDLAKLDQTIDVAKKVLGIRIDFLDGIHKDILSINKTLQTI